MRHLFRLKSQPEELDGEYFDTLFREAELANLSALELETYKETMTTELDIYLQMEYAKAKGLEQGLAKGIEQNKIENAKNLKSAGVSLDTIAVCIGLDLETVKAL